MFTREFSATSRRTSRVQLLGAVAFAIGITVLVKNSLAQVQTDQPLSTGTKKLVATILDKSKLEPERSAAYSKLYDKLEPEECRAALREVLRSGDAQF